jgi:hypothetical protein
MNDYNVSAIKFFFQEFAQPLTGCIRTHVEIRKRVTETLRRIGNGALPFGSKISYRPSISFFVATDFMPKPPERAR